MTTTVSQPVTEPRPAGGEDDWSAREALAEALIPLVGRLFREHGVITAIYGRSLVNAPTDVIEAYGTTRSSTAPSGAWPTPLQSSTYSRRSPGWHSSTRHIASRVENRTALARPFFSTETLAGVRPISSAKSPTLSFRFASCTSILTTMGIK